MQMERRNNNGGIGIGGVGVGVGVRVGGNYYYHNPTVVDHHRSSPVMESSSSSSPLLFPIYSSSITSSPPPSLSPQPQPQPPPSYSSPAGVAVGVGGVGYIEHSVSKFDTLAGVAIKYGVEVADIKKMNGLVTDLQMFALKTLHIPLPGRHPPSPNLANGFDTPGPSSYEQTPPSRRHSDLFDSLQSLKLKSCPQRKVSPAMSTLQGYYGLKSKDRKAEPEGCEMAVYQKGSAHYLEDGHLESHSNPPLSRHRKCKSVAHGFLPENGNGADDFSAAESGEDSSNWIEKLLRRRQKSEADFKTRTPEMLMKEDNSGGGAFLATAGKGLALRPKAASRTTLGADTETGWQNGFPVGVGDSSIGDNSSGVRKSSSTSNLQDSEISNTLSSIWPTSKWNLKSDLQALSTAAITRPIFDGLPKPVTGRRNKAAID